MRRLLYPVSIGLLLTGLPLMAQAQQRPAPPASEAAGSSIVLEAGSGRVIQAGRAITNLFAADPKIAEVRPASPTSVFVFGVAPGRTTIAALDQAGGVVGRYEVTVRPSAFGADEAQAAVRRALPHSDVTVRTTMTGLTISGQVRSPAEADQAARIVKAYLGDKQDVDNELAVTAGVQINLRVRIAEISRQVTRRFGINWNALGNFGRIGVGSGLAAAIADPFNSPSSPSNTLSGTYASGSANINAVLDLLAQDNLATILAEPNLTAMSGETASFLSGGEYPIPVAQQNNTISIEYKQYGISLAFVPTVLEDNHINIRVRPEVSQLTTQGAVQLGVGNNTIAVPALTVRRAETSVELGSGQSFAIAGLLQSQNTIGNSGLPYASEAPVIGSLFGSNNFQRNDSELVIIVTPYIVRPVDSIKQLHAPTDNYAPPDDFQRVAMHRQRGPATDPDVIAAHLPGGAGFILN